jgi:quercetin dioxygenase-like cupin family protein
MISTAPLTTARDTESFTVLGIQITPKVAASETGGQFSMIEEVLPPGLGVPPNIGHNESRVYYVVSGEFQLQVGNVTHRAAAGDTFFVPAGAVNGFANVGPEPGKLFATFTPAGHEDFLRELSDLIQGEPREDEVAELFQRYGVEMVS